MDGKLNWYFFPLHYKAMGRNSAWPRSFKGSSISRLPFVLRSPAPLNSTDGEYYILKNVILTFCLIGLTNALSRAANTIQKINYGWWGAIKNDTVIHLCKECVTQSWPIDVSVPKSSTGIIHQCSVNSLQLHREPLFTLGTCARQDFWPKLSRGVLYIRWDV